MITPFHVRSGDLFYNTLTGKMASGSNLERFGFITDKSPDELIASVERPGRLRADLSNIQSVTVFTTTDCNAKCSYCYEHGLKHRAMSDEVARDAAEWVAARASDVVHLRMFGGEPLMNRKAIEIFCNTMKSHGIKYQTSIITNGLLLEGIPLSWHLKRVQVTLDGPAEAYEKEKGFPLAPILENIRSVTADGVRVVIRINVGSDEREQLALCDVLKGMKGITAYAHVLFGEEPNYEGVLKVNHRLDDLGIPTDLKLPKYRDFFCMADSGRSVCINPEGCLTLCEHYCDEEIIGSIYKDGFDQGVIRSWREFAPKTEECRTCFLRPVCRKLIKCSGVSETCTKEYRDYMYRETQRKMEMIHRRKK